MGSPVLTHALAAASRGLAVLPLSRSKLPAIRSPHPAGGPAPAPCHGQCGLPGHGVHDATTDPDAVRALFAAAPWATAYGIACGRPPLHVIGLDLDVKHGTDPLAALARLARAHAFVLPPTVTVLTPSGGRHLLLRGPAGVAVPNSAGRLAPGIDVRGSGGYLVGPGSVTARGTYELALGSYTRAPAPVPPALLRLLAPPPGPAAVRLLAPPPGPAAPARTAGAPPYGAARADAALVRFVRAAPVGERNARLFWAACRAHETGRGEALTPALVEAAVAAGLTEREARGTVTSAARRTAAAP
ncbi:DNA primase [Streptomyces armeniacus]|uniref:DNA primase n=1 Tax=Streptomyces armeniacus TaxID=83291 RepID=A0A345XYV8_9ACTN|nr:bifunctional DNA primase/polymerase [Streptomyces armeniacus]AXK36824.1 DNA primase [Streptomyces armeniacus]